ncbi:MAG: hypothetical protein KDA38_12205, partial [Planctomycetales bacterium]|nr:hypothetical protein [Planctomycetales bacterium]
ENAAGVDHRADIYSLGCTLYALLAGRPPFDGATALEVITKQKTQPVPRIESIDASIPQPLAETVMRMVAKQPDERFANLDEVIEQLERFLAADGSASVPNEEHVATLETAVAEFHQSPAAKFRGLLATAFVGGCFGVALLALFWSFKISSGFLVMAVAATFGYFAITGVRERTTLFDKLRAWLFTARWSDWAVGLCGALLLLVIAWVGDCLIAWTVFAIVGVAMAAGFHLTIDAMVWRQQQPAIDRVESMLKSLRLRGLDEVKLREFVAQYGGANWEGLFEAIFGYEAKLTARETITSGRRRKFRAWRDPLIRGIDARLAAHRAAREQRHLQKVEQASLRAKGVDPAAAREQAEQLAAAMVEQASEVRRAPVSAAPAAVDPKLAAAQKRARIKAMLADARSGKYSRHSRSSVLARTFGLAFSGKVRFLLGCLLLGGCVLWMKQNGWLSAEEVTSATMQAVRDRNLTEVTAVADGVVSDLATQQTDSSKSLALPLVGRLFDSFNPGVAGLLLIALSIFRGWRMSLFALPAAAIMVLGPSLGIPGVEALGGSHTTSLALGGAIGAVGLLLGRTENDDEN